MKKGFTLIEVIMGITLIGIISIFFIPSITFGYKYLSESKKFTKAIFMSQQEIENLMEEKRKEEFPGDEFTQTIFGMKVKGHNISVPIESYGEINVFQPKKEKDYEKPKIVRDVNSGLDNIVKLSAFDNSYEYLPPPKSIDMFKNNGDLNIDINFLVDKKYYKIFNRKTFLVNVHRWYTSSMTEDSEEFILDNYFVIKEWNGARPLVNYEESKASKTIPNIQNNPEYNRLTFPEIKDGLKLDDTELINQYGNRYLYYSVTPFAISGKIGEEKFSNSIYIKAPRIEVDRAEFGPADNELSIVFKDSIGEESNQKISLDLDLGVFIVSRSDESDKMIILKFENDLPKQLIQGKLQLGSVESLKYGAINIWSNNNPNGEFVVNP